MIRRNFVAIFSCALACLPSTATADYDQWAYAWVGNLNVWFETDAWRTT
jgi:hypothetical protein